MSTVWKYQLVSFGSVLLKMPKDAKPLSANLQSGFVTLWAEVDPEKVLETRAFVVVGTGHPLPAGSLSYISTVMDGPYVWHVFEMK